VHPKPERRVRVQFLWQAFAGDFYHFCFTFNVFCSDMQGQKNVDDRPRRVQLEALQDFTPLSRTIATLQRHDSSPTQAFIYIRYQGNRVNEDPSRRAK
jgi:hypothetical protein